MAYSPIENYGLIGNMHTAALVGMNGAIEWFCYPKFDSPSVFGSLLDEKKGGHFRISPVARNVKQRQFYLPDTNILLTRFLNENGVGEIRDFMPIPKDPADPGRHWLVREVRGIRGQMTFRMQCTPAFGYGRERHETKLKGSSALFESPNLTLVLESEGVPLQASANAVHAEFRLKQGETVWFVLREIKDGEKPGQGCSREHLHELGQQTFHFWHHWIAHSSYRGRWREMVNRSALALKLLTYEPTGAVIAAPTTSLPECLRAGRNWDYRYTWIRDAAFTMFALLKVGFEGEASAFLGWLERVCRDERNRPPQDPPLRVLYSIDGHEPPAEDLVDHWEGYAGSKSVRIGNAAKDQLQLDIYGPLLDAVYLFCKRKYPLANSFWDYLSGYVEWIGKNWRRQDSGIWEVRGEPRDFVYSKLMCWVAVDRAMRLSQLHSFPAPRADWNGIRDDIYREVLEKGWSESKQSYVDYFGGTQLDASNFLLPIMQFLSPTDERFRKTLKAMRSAPDKGGLVSNAFVYRYLTDKKLDSFQSREGTFNICTFWYVEALLRAGQVDRRFLQEARWVFEHMLGFANHLGLYSEEIGPRGEFLGNFPQAFSHLALITAASNLDLALDRKGIST